MTLDLDELERKAKVALSYDPDPGEDPWFRGRLHPDAVLALIERVRGLEKTIATMTAEYDDLREQARERGLNV